MDKKIETLDDLYIDELRDLYHAEKQLADALPRMAGAVASAELRAAFTEDADRTKTHVNRLEKIFQSLGRDPQGHRCKGMQGLLEEGLDLIREGSRTPVRDAGLIITARKAQQYEIAGYGGASAFARLLGRGEDERILQQTISEEKAADTEFSRLAERTINRAAAAN